MCFEIQRYQDIEHTGGEQEKKLSSELQETLDLATAYEPYLQSHLPALLRYPKILDAHFNFIFKQNLN